MKKEKIKEDLWLSLAIEYLSYNSENGFITVIKSYQQSEVGKIIGFNQGEGYLSASFMGKRFLVHRMAWFLHNGEWPNMQIDHINRNRKDNRITNLRKATHAQNCQNIGLSKRNKTGIAGVCFRRGFYEANISINNKNKYLGRFDTLNKAAEIRRAYEISIRGEFANHE